MPLIALAVERALVFLAESHSWYVIAYTVPLATALTFLIVLKMTRRLSAVLILHAASLTASHVTGLLLQL